MRQICSTHRGRVVLEHSVLNEFASRQIHSCTRCVNPSRANCFCDGQESDRSGVEKCKEAPVVGSSSRVGQIGVGGHQLDMLCISPLHSPRLARTAEVCRLGEASRHAVNRIPVRLVLKFGTLRRYSCFGLSTATTGFPIITAYAHTQKRPVCFPLTCTLH